METSAWSSPCPSPETTEGFDLKPSRQADPALEDEVVIVHRDEERLVVLKPPGLATTRPDEGPCLVRAVQRLDPDAPKLHATSRLDAEVSGLVTFARTAAGNERLLRARRDHSYRRRYLALGVLGPGQNPLPAEGRWDWAIGVDPRDKRRRRADAPDAPRAKASATRFSVERALATSGPEGAATLLLLRLEPETGRTHQLRVHAAAAGAPLLGDVHYGGARRLTLPDGRVHALRRVALHCARLELPGLAGAPPLQVSAPLPAALLAALLACGGDEDDARAALELTWLER